MHAELETSQGNSKEEIESMSSLELRLEISKSISNLRFNLLERIYNGQAVIEGYEHGNVELHIHGLIESNIAGLADSSVSRVYRTEEDHTRFIGAAFCGRIRVNSDSHRDSASGDSDNEVVVFVTVRNVGEMPRPVDSIIRLQALDSCRMRSADTFEEGMRFLIPESLWILIQRELSVILYRAGIKDRESVNKVIEACHCRRHHPLALLR